MNNEKYGSEILDIKIGENDSKRCNLLHFVDEADQLTRGKNALSMAVVRNSASALLN